MPPYQGKQDHAPGGARILAITGHADAYDRESVIKAGADDYLLKPIDKKSLLQAIAALI